MKITRVKPLLPFALLVSLQLMVAQDGIQPLEPADNAQAGEVRTGRGKIESDFERDKALLKIVLPCISEFAQKLQLPVPIPMATNSIAKFLVYGDEENPKATVTLTNGMEFRFHHGIVAGFTTANSYFNDPPQNRVKEFYGTVTLDNKEAVAVGRQFVNRLGYDERILFLDLEPRIDPPEKYRNGTIPRYGIEWIDPRTGIISVHLEVDGQHGTVESLSIINSNVQCESQKPGINVATWLRTNETIGSLMKDIGVFSERIGLVINPPLALTQITNIRITGNGPYALTVLDFSNGYTFFQKVKANLVVGFLAPDAFFAPGRAIRATDYKGTWKMSPDEAVNLVRDAIQKLGYTEKSLYLDRKPSIGKPILFGADDIPRFRVHWDDNEQGSVSTAVTCEVDAMNRQVKSIFIFSSFPPTAVNLSNDLSNESTKKAVRVAPVNDASGALHISQERDPARDP